MKFKKYITALLIVLLLLFPTESASAKTGLFKDNFYSSSVETMDSPKKKTTYTVSENNKNTSSIEKTSQGSESKKNNDSEDIDEDASMILLIISISLTMMTVCEIVALTLVNKSGS